MQTALYQPKAPVLTQARTNKRIILYLILVVAVVPRLYHIDQHYVDIAGWRQTSVAMMADNYYHRNPNILFPEVSWNGPGESYNGREFQTVSYTASLLYHVFGQHDWVGRLVNVFFGVWGVFALYRLVRRVWDEKHGLVSAAVLALLPGAIYFDRTFLPDPAMVALVTTSLWLLMAYLQTDQRKYLIATLLTACLGFLTKITGMLVLLPMLYAVLVIYHKRRKLTIPVMARLIGPALVVFGIVVAYYLWARYLSHNYPPYHFAGEANWLWDEGLKTWLGQGYFLEKTGYIFQNWTLGKPFIWLSVAGVFLSVFYIISRKQTGSSGVQLATGPYFFHFWLAGYLVFYAIGAKELIGNFWNFHIGSPMIAAFSSSTLVFMWNVLKRWKWVAIAAGVLVFAVILKSDRRVLRNTFTDQYYIADYRMGQHLQQLRKPSDLVVVLSHDIGNPIPIFYSKGRGWVFPPAGKENWDYLPATDAACITTLEALRAKGAAWFGINRDQFNTFQTSYPQFAQYLTSHFPKRADAPDYVIFQLK